MGSEEREEVKALCRDLIECRDILDNVSQIMNYIDELEDEISSLQLKLNNATKGE